MRILLVENNLGDARHVQALLKDAGEGGPEVTHVTRIDGALECLAQERFDAVLLDLSLSDASGMASAQRLMANAPTIPIIILSGEHNEEKAMLAVQEGAEDYLVKGRVEGFALVRSLRYAIRRHTRTQRLAHHDPLTDLPNRLLFGDRLRQTMAQALRYSTKWAVLFMDLDGFKAVNDRHGHDAGDLVLRTIAQRCSACLRESDTLARIGGDEFVIILPAAAKPDDAAAAARKIIEVVNQPIALDSLSVTLGASIGISLFPYDAQDADTLLKCADEAMYRAKKEGKNRYQFHCTDPASELEHQLPPSTLEFT